MNKFLYIDQIAVVSVSFYLWLILGANKIKKGKKKLEKRECV